MARNTPAARWLGRACLLLVAARAAAQEAAFAPPYVPTSGIVVDVAAGDIDGDGDVDLVGRTDAGLVVVVQALGLGDFAPDTPLHVDVVGGLPDLALADLDGDGRADLLLANDVAGGPADELLVLLADAVGGFGAPVPHAIAADPREVALGDFDADGALDVAVACEAGLSCSVLYGDGLGGLAPKLDVAAGGAPHALAVGDLTGDGHADLVVALKASGKVALVRALPGGDFAGPALTSVASGPDDVALGDTDSDGDLDAITCSQQATALSVLRNDGGVLASPQLASLVFPADEVLAPDLDDDGDADLVSVMHHDVGVEVLDSHGDGSFAPSRPFGGVTALAGLVVADLNGDGDLDLAAGRLPPGEAYGPPALTVLIGNGEGGLGPLLAVHGYFYELGTGDVDGDGLPDIVTTATHLDPGPQPAALFALGGSEGASEGYAPLGSTADDERIVAPCDFDGDGLSDVVVPEASYTLRVWFSDGASFTRSTLLQLPVGAGVFDIVPADVDGHDGIDLLVACGSKHYVAELLNDGAGGLAALRTIDTGHVSPTLVAAGDVDGDGVTDVVVAGAAEDEQRLSFVRGLGAGAFSQPQSTRLPDGTADLDLGDVDEDGDLDAFGCVFSAVLVLRYDAGEFGAPEAVLFPGWAIGRMRVLDADGDGHQDIVAIDGTTESKGAGLRRGLGDGTFGPLEVTPGPYYEQDLAVADLDLDGRPEVMVNSLVGSTDVLHNELGPWQPLGHALAGAQGLPELVGTGTLQPGRPVSLRLDDAQPGAAAALVLGGSALLAPFKGGVLVPAPDRLLAGLPVDAAGQVLMSGAAPALPTGFELYLQAWIVDRQAVAGLAASGGLRVTWP